MFFLMIFYFDHAKAGADFTKDLEIPFFLILKRCLSTHTKKVTILL